MTEGSGEAKPALVSRETKQAGEVRARWAWAEPSVWTERMLTALEQGVKGGSFLCRAGAVLHGRSPCDGLSILSEVNHRLESRMREIRLSGSEGGGTEANWFSLPLSRPAPT